VSDNTDEFYRAEETLPHGALEALVGVGGRNSKAPTPFTSSQYFLDICRRGINFSNLRAIKLIISFILLGIVFAVLTRNYDFTTIRADLHRLSLLSVIAVAAALLLSALAASLRFKIIAADIGHPAGFRQSMAAVSAGSLAGAMFFQIAGQLIARGAVMARHGAPFASVVVITAYERILAAILSGLVALAGAYYIFGKVYLEQSTGGAQLIKIMCGLIAATIAGAFLGYGRVAASSITPLLTRNFARRCLRVIVLTFLVQIPMMAAYVIASHALSKQASIADLVAASAMVMFAASVPISFAGWGVREMSAILALGTIGVGGDAAFTTAVIIGTGSLLSMGIIAVMSLPNTISGMQKVAASTAISIDYGRALAWILPIGAAVLVLFQVYVPVGSVLLNVNFGDPIAILASALFILNAIKRRRMPQWRALHVNLAVGIATLVLAGSLIIGASHFGWTTWALVNRFLGWFILLAFGATGSLIVTEGGTTAFRILLLTFAGATIAIAGIEISLELLNGAGVYFAGLSIVLNGIEGFSLNHNFFAFQLLMALSATIVFARGAYLRIALFALVITAFWFAGSRSGWIAAVLVLGVSLHLGVTAAREILIATICAASMALIALILHSFSIHEGMSHTYTEMVPPILQTPISIHERMLTIIGGLKLFLAHPFFGTGLGTFRNQNILATSGIPLLIHSTALWLLAELGIVGFLVFAVPFLYVFTTEWRHARTEKASTIIVLCFVAFAVMSGPADMLYQRTFWLLVGAALALIPQQSAHTKSS
jgi:hypothetical protein